MTFSFLYVVSFDHKVIFFMCGPLPQYSRWKTVFSPHLSFTNTRQGAIWAVLTLEYQWSFITSLYVWLCSVVGPGLSKVSFWCFTYICFLSWSASWGGSTPLISQRLSAVMLNLLVDLISGRRIGAAIGFAGMRLLSCPDLLLLLGLSGQQAWRGCPLCRSPCSLCGCYPFPWIWFVTSICTITRNLIRLCACQMI